jgi:hypothetical protein
MENWIFSCQPSNKMDFWSEPFFGVYDSLLDEYDDNEGKIFKIVWMWGKPGVDFNGRGELEFKFPMKRPEFLSINKIMLNSRYKDDNGPELSYKILRRN